MKAEPESSPSEEKNGDSTNDVEMKEEGVDSLYISCLLFSFMFPFFSLSVCVSCHFFFLSVSCGQIPISEGPEVPLLGY